MIVIGLDLSFTCTGLAVFKDGHLAKHLAIKEPKLNKSWPLDLRCKWIAEAVGESLPKSLDVVKLEVLRVHARSFNVYQLACLRGHVMAGLLSSKLIGETVEVNPKTVKRQYTGNGNADKKEMVKATIEKFSVNVDHNVADAIAIACTDPV